MNLPPSKLSQRRMKPQNRLDWLTARFVNGEFGSMGLTVLEEFLTTLC
jgi:hypothetical protein